MRHVVAIAITIGMGILFLARPYWAWSDGPAANADNGEVKVSLPVLEGNLTTESVLHVIIENVSDKAENHFEEWNSWGYGNLTVEWTDGQGKTGTVEKVPGQWTRNGPSTVVLQPGESLVRDISFDPKLWRGWPAIGGLTTLTVRVTYHPTGMPKFAEVNGWIGMVTSKERAISIVAAKQGAN